ncbi:hypothetical protein DCCM_2217 [Desulfocucumis palustris]|uniref:Uncharacterized protein n=1 Tax=Desulfocucumis palustris TaxID=1898651 RepID=A0A2L2XAK5_9FIRM|nr:hypothetical protein DCCM_2217 [Desulfocucumis palustris]
MHSPQGRHAHESIRHFKRMEKLFTAGVNPPGSVETGGINEKNWGKESLEKQ